MRLSPDVEYEALFAQSLQGIARIDLTGNILDVNRALVERSGFSRERLIGSSLADFTGADEAHVLVDLLGKLREGTGSSHEIRLIDKAGTPVPRRIFLVPVISSDGPAGGFVVIQDISAQVEARQFARLLFELNPHGIVTIDSTGRVTDINAAAMEMSGYSRDDVIGKSFLDFSPPERRPVAQELLSKTLAGEPQAREMRPVRKDGTSATVHLTTIPMRIDGLVQGAYVVYEDIEERKQHASLLIESEERFRSLFAQNPDPIVAIDRDGRILDVNDALLRMDNQQRESLIGQNFRDFLAPDEIQSVLPQIERTLAGEAVSYEFTYRNRQNRAVTYGVTSFPMIASGRVMGAYAVLVDETAEREARRRAEAQERRIRELYHVAVTSGVAESQITSMLAAGCRLLHMDAGFIVNCVNGFEIEQRFEAGAGQARLDSAALADLAAEAASANGPVVVTSKSPAAAFSCAVAVPLSVAGHPYGAVCFATTRDAGEDFERTDADLVALISALLGGALERRRSRANLKTLAYFDSLTGLPNRVFIQERLRDAIETAQSNMRRVALIFFDLDRFKDVNDTLGHALGDRLLQHIATRLREAVGERGIVARMGGDEFAVLLTMCETLDDVRTTAEELLAIVDDPVHLDEYEQFVTASAGISIYPDDGKDDQTLIKNADIAMYRAKDLGRNVCQFYAPSLEATIQMRLSQEKLLRRALENDEFVVYYQPQVDMLTGKIAALEALVRWNHPKTGLIYPGRFIPSAEMSGLIVPLGDWVLHKATEQLSKWRADHPELRVAVNLSAKQFHQTDLRSRIAHALEQSGLAPEALEMEITESVAMTHAAESVQIMRDLVEAGIRIGLDDFGTGYSSLSYLRRFPAAVLKIDRSFVAGIGVEGNDETIVITVIAMAHNLGLEVVAEGVETGEQYDFLRTYGCDRVQGYYISPAVPVSGIEALLAEWRPNES